MFSGVLNTMVGNQAEILWILLNQTWQTNLLWPMIPPVPEQKWLAYHYTKLGRWTQFGQWMLPVPEQRWLTAYHYTKLGRLTQWQRFGSSIHHFWDTPQHYSEQLRKWLLFIPATQKSLARWTYFGGAEHNDKGLKALAFTISEIPHSIFSKHIFA